MRRRSPASDLSGLERGGNAVRACARAAAGRRRGRAEAGASAQSKYAVRIDKFYVVSPAVPNGAGDHRAPRTPPWRRAVRLRAPYA